MKTRNRIPFLYALALCIIALTVGEVVHGDVNINEKVTVAAHQRTEQAAKSGSVVDASFQNPPDPNKPDEIIVNDPRNIKGTAAGPCDALHDKALLSFTHYYWPVTVRVEHRDGIGNVYWIELQPHDHRGPVLGSGGFSPQWSDVGDLKTAGVFVLQDLNGGGAATDPDDNPDPVPSLNCYAAPDDGKGDVKFLIQESPGSTHSYNWAITQAGTAVDSGVLNEDDSFSKTKSDLDPGTYTVSLTEPGVSTFNRQINFTISNIWIVSVSATSDHGTLLTYDQDFNNGPFPQTFTKPDWTSDGSKNNPISHTWNKQLQLDLVVQVAPDNAAAQSFNISGTGCGNFSAPGTSISGGQHTIHLIATNPIPTKINKITTGINWTISLNGNTMYTQNTGPSTVYVTMGTPFGTWPTLKRMDYVVSLARGQDSDRLIAVAVGSDATSGHRFDISRSIFANPPTYTTAWQVLNPDYVNPHGGGDCATLSTLMLYELEMLGVQGASVKYVHACTGNWDHLVSNSPSLSDLQLRVPNNLGTGLGFLNGAAGGGLTWNNYEGCCFWNGEYWMGGSGKYETDPKQVLHDWADPNTLVTGNHQAWDDQQNNVVPYP